MAKIITVESVLQEIEKITDPIILAGGCFDVLHPGHITFLSKAKKIGGTLVVFVESDEKIKSIKGEKRPIHSQKDRVYILSHLTMIDYIIPLPFFHTHKEYENLVYQLHPTYFAVTKNDPVITYIQPQAETIHASVIEVTERIDAHASSHIIKELNI